MCQDVYSVLSVEPAGSGREGRGSVQAAWVGEQQGAESEGSREDGKDV
jgi:hypothetical protein